MQNQDSWSEIPIEKINDNELNQILSLPTATVTPDEEDQWTEVSEPILESTRDIVPKISAEDAKEETPITDALKMVGQGATFGFADEIVGSVKALPSLLDESKNYKDERKLKVDEYRADIDRIRQDWPTLAPALEIAGGLVVPVPGGGLKSVATAAKALKGASKAKDLALVAGQMAKTGAIGAGLQGLGDTKEEEITDQLKDALISGATGAAISPVLGAATSGVSKAVVKGSQKLGDVKDVAIGWLTGLTQPEVKLSKFANIKKAKTLPDLSEEVLKSQEKIAKEGYELAQEAAEALSKKQTVDAKPFLSQISEVVQTKGFDDKSTKDLTNIAMDIVKQGNVEGKLEPQKLKELTSFFNVKLNSKTPAKTTGEKEAIELFSLVQQNASSNSPLDSSKIISKINTIESLPNLKSTIKNITNNVKSYIIDQPEIRLNLSEKQLADTLRRSRNVQFSSGSGEGKLALNEVNANISTFLKTSNKEYSDYVNKAASHYDYSDKMSKLFGIETKMLPEAASDLAEAQIKFNPLSEFRGLSKDSTTSKLKSMAADPKRSAVEEFLQKGTDSNLIEKDLIPDIKVASISDKLERSGDTFNMKKAVVAAPIAATASYLMDSDLPGAVKLGLSAFLLPKAATTYVKNRADIAMKIAKQYEKLPSTMKRVVENTLKDPDDKKILALSKIIEQDYIREDQSTATDSLTSKIKKMSDNDLATLSKDKELSSLQDAINKAQQETDPKKKKILIYALTQQPAIRKKFEHLKEEVKDGKPKTR
jgi:hypothetical protein